MQENNNLAQQTYIPSDWLTINEAVKLARKNLALKSKIAISIAMLYLMIFFFQFTFNLQFF